ncbi:four helix bundle protein [Paracrocinitomix mangrovi]|uniref:four helix bundle protein n=1 Tax=Paracrocinitomix mangrovi TaxID=2862509 RepID=UPI001C8D95BA|nr:four helix bundle protein [Paracrocinitomix mangrovi]UKN02797.1 four helix bundle protein [Paracrocinitomix mangrovi]
MSDFTELQAWKEGRIFRNTIREFVQTLPKNEEYRLKDQIIRSSRSVTNNIAEGHGRFHYQENIQFCRAARGSLTETKDHLIIALDHEYINQNEFDDLMSQYEKCIKILNGYINFLGREKQKFNDNKKNSK